MADFVNSHISPKKIPMKREMGVLTRSCLTSIFNDYVYSNNLSHPVHRTYVRLDDTLYELLKSDIDAVKQKSKGMAKKKVAYFDFNGKQVPYISYSSFPMFISSSIFKHVDPKISPREEDAISQIWETFKLRTEQRREEKKQRKKISEKPKKFRLRNNNMPEKQFKLNLAN